MCTREPAGRCQGPSCTSCKLMVRCIHLIVVVNVIIIIIIQGIHLIVTIVVIMYPHHSDQNNSYQRYLSCLLE